MGRAADRLLLVWHLPPGQHIEILARAFDVALDAPLYNGGLTTVRCCASVVCLLAVVQYAGVFVCCTVRCVSVIFCCTMRCCASVVWLLFW